VGPGDVFVVVRVVEEAAVEDADESVAECCEGLVVGVARRSSVVVGVKLEARAPSVLTRQRLATSLTGATGSVVDPH
jgi:hypothetical protein